MTASHSVQREALLSAIGHVSDLVLDLRNDASIPLPVRWAMLFDARKALEAITGTDEAAGQVRGWMREQQEKLLEHFAESGMQSFKTEFGTTLFIHSQLWAGTKEGSTREQAVAALKGNGYEDYVREAFNIQTLSSKARELASKDEAFPLAVLEHVAVTERVEIRARRS